MTRVQGRNRSAEMLQGPRRVRVLIVDPDKYFRKALAELLGRNGYLAFEAADGAEALEFLRRDPIHLVILEWRLGAISGIEALRDIRARWPDLPVVFFSTLSEPIYEEEALACGASDFIDKGRGNAILVRRLDRAMERHFPKFPVPVTLTSEIEVGPLRVIRDRRLVWWKGQEIKLTGTEFRMVLVFAERAGRELSYRTLYDLVHGTGVVSGRGNRGFRDNVRHFVQKIRDKFGKVDPGFAAIETYQAFGYRWRVAAPQDGGEKEAS